VAEIEFIEAKEAFYDTVRGWAFFPFQSEALPFNQVDGTSFHVVKTNPGEIRGNHRHPEVEEWLHIFGGPAVFHWQTAEGNVNKRDLDNDYTIVRVKAGVAHALSNPGPGPVYLIAFRTEPPQTDLPVAEPAPDRMIEQPQIRDLFSRVAPRYDALNHLFSLRRDIFWRRAAARVLGPTVQGPLLDLGCGTLDLVLALGRQYPDRLVVGCDFSLGMMRLGRPKLTRTKGRRPTLAAGDGLHLPFGPETFAGAASAFVIRNIEARLAALREVHRTLKPGGRLVVLELGVPQGRLAAIYLPYLIRLMPLAARLLTPQPRDYVYLGRSILNFPPTEEFLALMGRAGFRARALPLNRGLAWLFIGDKAD